MQNLKKNRFVVSKMTRIWWTLIQALKSLKNLQFDWSLSCNVYNVWPKKVQRSFLSWHCRVKHQKHQKCQNWYFHGILLSKVGNVWAKNLQWCYVKWLWRMMKNLKTNWLVVLKLTSGIWRIFTRVLQSLKHLHFNGILLTKVYNIWANKVQWSYISWHYKVMQNLKKNWLVVWKMT